MAARVSAIHCSSSTTKMCFILSFRCSLVPAAPSQRQPIRQRRRDSLASWCSIASRLRLGQFVLASKSVGFFFLRDLLYPPHRSLIEQFVNDFCERYGFKSAISFHMEPRVKRTLLVPLRGLFLCVAICEFFA